MSLTLSTFKNFCTSRFKNNCRFRSAPKQLADKAQKAWFAIRRAFITNQSNDPALILKLFDTLVRPIITYASEIVGQDSLNYFDVETIKWENTPFEQLHNKVCKNILGIRRNASGLAAKAELGRYPLLINIAQLTIKYYTKIIADPSKITYFALRSEQELHDNGKKSWISFVNKLLDTSGISLNQVLCKPKSIIPLLKEKFEKTFFSTIGSTKGVNKKTGNKLRTYAKFKINYEIENYLNCRLPKHITSAIAKLRTSTHNLEIETGRYIRPRIPPENRICKCCSSSAIEDETHFLLNCTAYTELRNDLFDIIGQPNEIIGNTEILIRVMTLKEKTDNFALGLYICKANQKRKTILNAH